MTNLRKKVFAAISAGAMLFSVVSPAAAQTTLQVTGNGSDSTSAINLSQAATTNVVQHNDADIHNNVDASANSGSNDANRNTGGNVTVDTGNAKTDVAVSNQVNSNSANVACCAAQDTAVLISGNGANSTNDANLSQASTTAVYQDNKADIKNDVDAKSNTGKNDANRNTGGDVQVTTGNATTLVDVSNTANANRAQVGGGTGANQGHVDVRIVGNGSDSDNDVNLLLAHSTVLSQDNNARIHNDVDADANSGKNDANRNTGGDVIVDTGDAKVDVAVDNAVNFNWAEVDCGCLLDIFAKVAGNGDHSTNDINAALANDLNVFQDNCGQETNSIWELSPIRRHNCSLNNDVDAKAKTGLNDANRNTGGPNGADPAVFTGGATSNVDVANSGNANAYGVAASTEWPHFTFGFNFNFGGLSLSELLALLGH